MRVLSVVGARPQFIKAAPVSRALRRSHEEVLVHTGQHYDHAMSGSFFHELEMSNPAVNLEVGSASHAVMTATILRRLEPVLLEHRPDGILLYGDTNSTLAAAVAGIKIVYRDGGRPWLAHVEGGVRAFNRQWPEEHNRVVADHLSDLVLAPTDEAMRNLRREGLAERSAKVGDVMVDSFVWAMDRTAAAALPLAREHPGYVLATLHRGDNVDEPVRLSAWLDAMRTDRRVILPAHPRTAATLARAGLVPPANVSFIDPVGYLTMVALEMSASLIITDSGGVQREAYLAGVPCFTVRDETEWVETLAGGWNRLVGTTPAGLAAALRGHDFAKPTAPRAEVFGDGHAAERIVAELEQLHARSSVAPAGPALAL
ncbi:MAG: UDP-N-acetylglucosamine 2-epimerase (non-hydrolyzing) [Chloroflexi bacterium]|nr:UDP-N-acetylglucosamine 2-epimerase (non-hydrolyzing) [Chloroflexota bacterium]